MNARRMLKQAAYFGLLFTVAVTSGTLCQAAERPNVVYILCDDLGYGDVRALNPERGKIATPNLDRLVGQGMSFRDAHSGSSVCSPTRYGILTGRYAWRTRLQNGVLQGYSRPLIAPDRLTAAALLKQEGYHTACIGKWHLGMEWERTAGGTGKAKPAGKEAAAADSEENEGGIDFDKPIRRGPTSVGFDYFFGVSASADMPPYTFLENDRVTVRPTVQKTFLRKGLAAPDFEAVKELPTFTRKAVEYLGARAADAKQGKPFFLYLPLTSPHTPIVPSPEFQGKSGLGAYGDFVMQTDDAIGQVLAALDTLGLSESTLVIVTSDNGCSPAAKTDELERQGHFASADRRGYKADIWDGGHRIPFLVRWPGKVKAGSASNQLICLTDLMATVAEVLGKKLPDNAGEDSVSILPALLGTDRKPLREAVVHHSIQGRFAIRQAEWKLELCPGSGGWSAPRDPQARKQNLPPVQLYNMTSDIGEKANQHHSQAETVSRLTRLLEKYVADGRSTPGAAQKNDVPVDIWKGPKGGAEE